MNIIARKPRGLQDNDPREYVVIDRDGFAGNEASPLSGRSTGRFVSATIDAWSVASGEWFWGHYFDTQEEALAHFNSRR